MNHCVAKIVEIVERGSDDRRSVLQLGYNLGRLSELTGLGREPFWDRWKDAVDAWDLPRLKILVRELHIIMSIPQSSSRSLLSEERPMENEAV
jgi:hypothetical protein